MASKQPFKLFDWQGILLKGWLSTKKFIRYNLLFNKKKLLLIGDTQSTLYQSLRGKIKKSWEVDVIEEGQLIGNQSQAIMKSYAELRKNNIYQSIVILPSVSPTEKTYNFQDEQFISEYPHQYLKQTYKNILGYRIASTSLSQTGLIVLSCNERQFCDISFTSFKQYEKSSKPSGGKPYEQKFKDSHYLLDGPISYLGLILGERYFLSLNSKSLIALTSQMANSDSQWMASIYSRWIHHNRLPYAGSFARFQPSEGETQSYVEYL